MGFSPWILTVFFIYFLVLIGIAVARARGMQEMSDYVLGGRRVGRITSALSAGSSAASGWTMLVFPALAFQHGLIELWTGLGIVVGSWLTWIVLAKRLRRFTIAAENSLTLPGVLRAALSGSDGSAANAVRLHHHILRDLLH